MNMTNRAQNAPVEGDRSDHKLRCIPDRMGCSVSEPTDRRSMVPDRMQDAYKLSRAICCNTSSPHIPEKQKQDISPPEVGQYHGSGLYQQPRGGGDGLQGIGRLSKEFMDVVPQEKHSHHSPTPTMCKKSDSRCGVSDYDRSVRLETESCSFQEDCQSLWSHRGGSICLPSDHTVPCLFQLAARSTRRHNRCVSAGLVSDTGLCQPTLEHDRPIPSPIPGPSTAGTHCSSGTSVEDTTMVPTASVIALPRLIIHDQIMLSQDTLSLPPQLAVWHISGRDTETRSFRRKLPHSCSNPGELKPIDLTTHSSGSGIAGGFNSFFWS